jgi:hypothetical protein
MCRESNRTKHKRGKNAFAKHLNTSVVVERDCQNLTGWTRLRLTVRDRDLYFLGHPAWAHPTTDCAHPAKHLGGAYDWPDTDRIIG